MQRGLDPARMRFVVQKGFSLSLPADGSLSDQYNI